MQANIKSGAYFLANQAELSTETFVRRLSTNIVVLLIANEGRATGITVTGREASFTRNEPVARWSREGAAAYEAEREALVFIYFLFFFDWCKVFRGQTIIIREGTGIFFVLSDFFRFHLNCFCGAAAAPCCAFSFVHTRYLQHIKKRK